MHYLVILADNAAEQLLLFDDTYLFVIKTTLNQHPHLSLLNYFNSVRQPMISAWLPFVTGKDHR